MNRLLKRPIDFVSGIISLCCCLLCYSYAPAQEHHASTDQVLEYSLMSLTQSAQDVAKRNDLLNSENQMYQEKVQYLQEQLKSLMEMQSQVSEEGRDTHNILENKSKQVSMSAKDVDQLRKEFVQLEGKRKKIEDKILARNQATIEIQNEIKRIDLEILELRDQVKPLDHTIDSKEFDKEKSDLLEDVKKGDENLKNVRRRYIQLEKKYTKPDKIVNDFKEQNADLKERLISLEEVAKVSLRAGESIQAEIIELDKKNESYAAELDQRIVDLQSRQKEMHDIVTKAQAKLKSNSTDLTLGEQDEKQLEESLTAVKKENASLKEEFASLTEKLEKMDTAH